MSLTRDYYVLASYAVPPRMLDFARDVLHAARKTNDDCLMTVASIIARNEPILIRQFASRADLNRWNDSLIGRINDCREAGVECEKLAREEELEQDDFDSWVAESEEVVDVATEFYAAFSYPTPADLGKLIELLEDAERPADKEDDDWTQTNATAPTQSIGLWNVCLKICESWPSVVHSDVFLIPERNRANRGLSCTPRSIQTNAQSSRGEPLGA